MADRNYIYDPLGNGPPVNQQSYRMEAGQLWRQYIIAGVANIAIVTTGYAMGWTSPVNIKIGGEDAIDSPLDEPLDADQLAWVGSTLTLGAVVGPFMGGFGASKIGRKWGLLCSVIPILVGWILVAAARNVAMIYTGRVLWGLSTGMLFTISPMYCAEIATDDSRGALGSFLQVFIVIGFLLAYAVGPFISYSAIAYVGVSVVALFCILFYFMPESPMYHLYNDNVDDAAQCLSIIRGKSIAGVQDELEKMANEVKASREKTANIADVFRGSNFKAFYISCALVFFQQFCGINAVLFYMTTIFEAAGADLDPAIATIIIGVVQVGASVITPFVVDRLGRRILLLISSCGTAIGLVWRVQEDCKLLMLEVWLYSLVQAVSVILVQNRTRSKSGIGLKCIEAFQALLGMYFVLDDNDSPIADSIQFLPVLSLVLFIVTYCWGLGPLPWAVLSELFPIEVKSIAAPIATAFCWALSFLVTRYFNTVAGAIGMGGTFFIFSGCCVLSFFFTLFMLPETKGKSFTEIQQILSGKPSQLKSEKA